MVSMLSLNSWRQTAKQMFVWGCVTVVLEDHYQPGFCNIVKYIGRSHFITKTYRIFFGKSAQEHYFFKARCHMTVFMVSDNLCNGYSCWLIYTKYVKLSTAPIKRTWMRCLINAVKELVPFVIWCLDTGSSISLSKLYLKGFNYHPIMLLTT